MLCNITHQKNSALGVLTLVALAGLALPAIGQHTQPSQPPSRPATTEPATTPTLIGKPAPMFALKDTAGKSHQLRNLAGKIVVIEWLDPTCAEARRLHNEGRWAMLIDEFVGEEIEWLTIVSQHGANKTMTSEDFESARVDLAIEHDVLIDELGLTFSAYRITHSPSVVIIDGQGIVAYMGGFDNAPKGVAPKGQTMTNHVEAALEQLLDGADITVNETPTYGCPIESAAPTSPKKPVNE